MITADLGTRVPDDWYDGFHRGLAARFWRAIGSLTADSDAALADRLLDTPRGGRILDAACGDGRIAVRLAALGHEVVALDIEADELEIARGAARSRGVSVETVQADLADPPALGRFDGALMWGNAFGYLPPSGTARMLAWLASSLNPGARLAIQSGTAAEALLAKGVEPERRFEVGEVSVTATNAYRASESRLETRFRFEADGHVEEASAAHHVHTTGEVCRMLRAGGFSEVSLLAPGGDRPFETGDEAVIYLARR